MTNFYGKPSKEEYQPTPQVKPAKRVYLSIIRGYDAIEVKLRTTFLHIGMSMNSMADPGFHIWETQKLRYELLGWLSDEDLSYKLPGTNPTLGELCREMGEVQHSYVQSLVTGKQSWDYKNDDDEVAESVARLKNWYKELDKELDSAVSAYTEEDVHAKKIDRSGGFMISPHRQLSNYSEALLIFYAKASVYLKALEKPLNERWQIWIG